MFSALFIAAAVLFGNPWHVSPPPDVVSAREANGGPMSRFLTLSGSAWMKWSRQCGDPTVCGVYTHAGIWSWV
jgi:hypothetical protein